MMVLDAILVFDKLQLKRRFILNQRGKNIAPNFRVCGIEIGMGIEMGMVMVLVLERMNKKGDGDGADCTSRYDSFVELPVAP